MEYKDFRKSLKKHRINGKEFGIIFDINQNSINNWRTRGVPDYVDKILELFDLLDIEKREEYIKNRLSSTADSI
jgi:hypothetical protein